MYMYMYVHNILSLFRLWRRLHQRMRGYRQNCLSSENQLAALENHRQPVRIQTQRMGVWNRDHKVIATWNADGSTRAWNVNWRDCAVLSVRERRRSVC